MQGGSMENLFIGNVMHRTNDNNVSYQGMRVSADNKGIGIWTVKYKAVLYRTKDGNFIDYEDLEKKEILPNIPKSNFDGVKGGYMGVFVDSESLIPYNELENKDDKPRKKQ